MNLKEEEKEGRRRMGRKREVGSRQKRKGERRNINNDYMYLVLPG